MKTLLFILAFTLILLSCKIKKEILYGKCQKNYYACSQILLKPNREFEYFIFYDVGGATILKGQWQTQKDTVILNTYEQEANRLDSVIELTTGDRKSTISFEGNFWGYITVDTSKIEFKAKQQSVEFDLPLKNITFHFYNEMGDLIPVHYDIKKSTTNRLLVKVRWVTTGSIIKNLKFVKKRNRLLNISKPWELKRTSIKNKQW